MNYFYLKLYFLTSLFTIGVFNAHAFITVGSDADCSFSDIQPAIDRASSTGSEIRIATNKTYFENLVIDNLGANIHTLSIRGGFFSCSDANKNIQSQALSVINGNQLGSVFSITSNTFIEVINLDHLKILNGHSILGGGGVNIKGVVLTLLISIKDSTISNNSSTGIMGGGGIFCQDIDKGNSLTNVSIYNTYISHNHALSGLTGLGAGGGMKIDGCFVIIYPPSKINNNTSSDSGGAIAISNGGVLELRTKCNNTSKHCSTFNDDLPISIRGNSAGFPDIDKDGGGIFLSGDVDHLSKVLGTGFALSENNARNGAAIYLQGMAELEIYRHKKKCWNENKCNLFSKNKTTIIGGVGGAIYNNNATVNLQSAAFEDNRADVATAIYTTGFDAKTEIYNSLFTHNGNNSQNGWSDEFVLRAYNGADLRVTESTIVDNHADTAIIGLKNNGKLLMFSSIIHDPTSGSVLNQVNATGAGIKCVIAHEDHSISGLYITVQNPDFVDRLGRDYHLKISSPAIDYCDSNFNSKDVDFQPHGYDHPDVANGFSGAVYDIGIDEFFIELIFKNGFENAK